MLPVVQTRFNLHLNLISVYNVQLKLKIHFKIGLILLLLRYDDASSVYRSLWFDMSLCTQIPMSVRATHVYSLAYVLTNQTPTNVNVSRNTQATFARKVGIRMVLRYQLILTAEVFHSTTCFDM